MGRGYRLLIWLSLRAVTVVVPGVCASRLRMFFLRASGEGCDRTDALDDCHELHLCIVS